MEFLTNPWVITIIVLAVIIGNIAALKYTAKMKFGPTNPETGRKEKTALDRLNELDRAAHPDKHKDKEDK
ncbi:DUF2897 family protein [Vibrio sp. HN007]|uniref:DUF2897 family protein n=1 Tax=Vibrio iocasae TaxID=3098914 RepID=UPI0035D4D84D